MKKVLFLLLALPVFFSCKKDSPSSDDIEYLIVGYSSCFCVDCCKIGYKIAGDQLFQGERTKPDEYVFQPAALDTSKFAIAKVLLDEFPSELLDENGKLYGCGGCADQAVYYIELKKGGQVYFWHIDSITEGFPDYVKTYSQHLTDVLIKLQ